MAAPQKKPQEKKPEGPLKPLKQFDHPIELAMARFSPCGTYLFAAGCDQLVHRHHLESGVHTVLKAHDGWLQGMVFHPDQKRMCTLDSWGKLAAWSYADDEPKPLWTRVDAHKGWAKHLSISPDGGTLATCGVDRAVRLWSSADGSAKAEFKAHDAAVFTTAFHPDGKSLVSGDLTGTIRHWDLAGQAPARTLDAKLLHLRPDEINDVGGVRALAFDGAGKALAAAGAQPVTSGFVTAKPAVILFDWQTGKQQQLLQPEGTTAEEGFALDLLFHPAGFLAVACSGAPGRGALWCWRPGEAKPLHIDKTLLHCRSVALHPDGKRLAIAQVGRGGGNGRKVDAKGLYQGNTGSVRIFEAALGA